jgi:hypothetical protein
MLKQQQQRMNSTAATRNVLKTRYVNAITRFNVFLISDREFIRGLGGDSPPDGGKTRAWTLFE